MRSGQPRQISYKMDNSCKISTISFEIVLFFILCCIIASKASFSLNDELTLTYHQKLLLDKFRARVENGLNQEYMKHDLYLNRWLRSTKYDLEASERLLLDNLEWREKNMVNEIETMDWSDFLEEYPYSTDIYDKEGRPTLLFNLGEWDVRKAAVSGQTQRLILYWAKLFEELSSKVRSLHGKNVTQSSLIVDIRDFNVVQHSCPQCISVYIGFISILQRRYPGEIHKANLVNAPNSFQYLMQILEPAMGGNGQRFKLYGTNTKQWQKALLTEYSAHQLPPEFGGSNRKLWKS